VEREGQKGGGAGGGRVGVSSGRGGGGLVRVTGVLSWRERDRCLSLVFLEGSRRLKGSRGRRECWNF